MKSAEQKTPTKQTTLSGNNRIAVVGLSHLGLVTSTGLAYLNKKVVGLDEDPKFIKTLQNQALPVYEPGLQELLKQVTTNIQFSDDFSLLANIPLIFLSQDTETDGSGSVEKLDYLLNLTIPHLKNQATIVCMSQVPIGYYRNLENKIKQLRPELKFHLYHMVDTIVMTNAIERFIHPERIIIGTSNGKKFSPQLNSFLKLFSCPVFKMTYESAEMTKAAINLYLANTVTFANTLSDFCESCGANINDVIPALQTDKRIGPYAYLRPNLRIAGGHLERDLLMFKRVAEKQNISSGVVKWILKQNNTRYKWAEDKLNQSLFKIVKKPIIAIWGLSYKKNTDSTHNAASIKIINDLGKKATLQVYDPMAKLPKKLSGYMRFNDKYEALDDADCLLILTEWDEFAQANLTKMSKLMKHHIVVDGVGILNKYQNKLKDFQYISLGMGKKV